jgi:hypothetical protein
MKKFNLIEILAAGTITIIVISLIYAAAYGKYDPEYDFDYSYLNPQIESAKNSRKIAEQLQRQNDLMLQQIEQQQTEKHQ